MNTRSKDAKPDTSGSSSNVARPNAPVPSPIPALVPVPASSSSSSSSVIPQQFAPSSSITTPVINSNNNNQGNPSSMGVRQFPKEVGVNMVGGKVTWPALEHYRRSVRGHLKLLRIPAAEAGLVVVNALPTDQYSLVVSKLDPDDPTFLADPVAAVCSIFAEIAVGETEDTALWTKLDQALKWKPNEGIEPWASRVFPIAREVIGGNVASLKEVITWIKASLPDTLKRIVMRKTPASLEQLHQMIEDGYSLLEASRSEARSEVASATRPAAFFGSTTNSAPNSYPGKRSFQGNGYKGRRPSRPWKQRPPHPNQQVNLALLCPACNTLHRYMGTSCEEKALQIMKIRRGVHPPSSNPRAYRAEAAPEIPAINTVEPHPKD